MSLKLGEMLVANKVISDAQLAKAIETQKQVGGKLGVILAKLRMVSEEQLAAFLAEQMKLPLLQLKDLVVYPNVSALVDVEVLEKNTLLPIRRSDETGLLVVIADPLDLDAIDNLQFLTGLRIETAIATRSNILKAIGYYFHGQLCPEIQVTEKERGVASGQHAAVSDGTRASPQAVLQALTELLIEKKLITQQEVLSKLAAKTAK